MKSEMRLALVAGQQAAQCWLHGGDWVLEGLWRLECVGLGPHDDVAHERAALAKWDCKKADEAQALTALAVT